MAKSIRAKSKLAAKAVKRKGEPQRKVDERNARIAMRAAGKEPAPTSNKFVHSIPGYEEPVKETVETEEQPAEAAEVEMEVDAKKVSTSGWKTSRHTAYQRAKKSKSSKFMKF
ncbi:unnamed protein product [Kuraishia capsulata CBS 1993]|uniref:DUF2423 domain-containing protein n=1 Tax=Kuraishia capsulata CBS 1993 TaxID=1382522 RepID=W6MUM2_9ASCO|nr:uncharacterized protein KUCA_T00005385001 [Kuraishia capsulata CBS 1993]CDK29397.1 unnamed protein product [Kuraishia capsulata CBS 1993]